MTVAILATEPADWHPLSLLVALVILAVGSDLLAIEARGLQLSGNFAAIILAGLLLGPAPALCVALVPILIDTVLRRPPLGSIMSNLAGFAIFPTVAALLAGSFDVADATTAETAGVVMLVFTIGNVLNFVLVYGYHVVVDGWAWRAGFRNLFAPVIPAQLAIGFVTVAVVYSVQRVGHELVVFLAPILLVLQWLLRTGLAASERGVALEERNRELASLQFGLISSMLKTLALRDNMTARHSAAVARYSRAMAQELGLSESDQELIHTAALFHDIGKFIFPDSILLSQRRLTEEEFDIVRRHPVVGAEVISEIEGYGPVAEIVLHHHERIDGLGYPAGIEGDEIPLGSRIIAVADTYDVITSRDTYQRPRPMAEAFAELERSAGTQLDADLVQLFIALMREGGVVFRHTAAEDFEAELALERRVSDYASPRKRAVA